MVKYINREVFRYRMFIQEIVINQNRFGKFFAREIASLAFVLIEFNILSITVIASQPPKALKTISF